MFGSDLPSSSISMFISNLCKFTQPPLLHICVHRAYEASWAVDSSFLHINMCLYRKTVSMCGLYLQSHCEEIWQFLFNIAQIGVSEHILFWTSRTSYNAFNLSRNE